MKHFIKLLMIYILIICSISNILSQVYKNVPFIKFENNKIIYIPDSAGNIIPDFSYCGYKNGCFDFSSPEIKAFVKWADGDMTQTIQSAIDYVGSLPLLNGFRGTIVIDTGIFKINGQLKINSSGIVIKGRTVNNKTTTLLATGYDRRILIKVKGDSAFCNKWYEVESNYIPAGSKKIFSVNTMNLNVGDQIYLRSTVTKNIIKILKTDWFGGETEWIGWKENERDLYFLRKIINIINDTIFIDVPLSTSLNYQDSKTYFAVVKVDKRIFNVGIENLILESQFNFENIKDENHSWIAISFDNSYDCWVNKIVFKHFAGNAVYLQRNTQRITVINCISLDPISEIGGWRRRMFFNEGQQNLFIKCYSELGYNDFACGFTACGPNAFVFCESYRSLNFSGSIDSWSNGILFDNVNIDGNALILGNIASSNMGAGWCAANSMIWNCSASKVICEMPPLHYNWAYGAWGQFEGRGIWFNVNSNVSPVSLYFQQLFERTGKIINIVDGLIDDKSSTSSPDIETAQKLADEAIYPRKTIKDFVLKEFKDDDIVINNKMKIFLRSEIKENITKYKSNLNFKITNGWFTVGNKVVTGKIHNIQWWRGNPQWYAKAKATPHITRFVPGKEEIGYTDNINDVVDWLKDNNYCALSHHYGLWYDRRRDDHERVRRIDGNVWAPFYEQPFDRSGKDFAWDGLSLYDLTKYNEWYWLRLKQFANIAHEYGIFLFNNHYFQHNILEAGAHWVDCPWRSANNINNTNFPEPPVFAGGKRIFMAKQFYDTTNVVRKQLHEKYILKNLENFKENNNVIHIISEEYTGPYDFMKFWLDCIKKWNIANNENKCKIALSCTKDIQDSVLNNSNLNQLIDIIDIKYWYYTNDGNIYMPPGGVNLAPRQYERIMKPSKVDFYSVYKSVYEYKIKYPNKVVIYNAKGSNEYPWAIFMAGGSFASIPVIKNEYFLVYAATMQPVDFSHEGYLLLKNDNNEKIIYFLKKRNIEFDLKLYKNYEFKLIDSESGDILNIKILQKNNKIVLEPENAGTIIWIYKKK